jgi:hypothetical protein
MKKINICGLTIIFFWFMSAPILAGDFDGSKPLICALMDLVECQPGGNCQAKTAEELGLPQFFRINFQEKKISGTQSGESGRGTAIERLETVDGKLILQGAEDGVEDVRDGVGWSLAIAEETGKLVLTASGDEVGFVVFGACTLP